MHTQSVSWKADDGISTDGEALTSANLVLYFGSRAMLSNPLCMAEMRALR